MVEVREVVGFCVYLQMWRQQDQLIVGCEKKNES